MFFDLYKFTRISTLRLQLRRKLALHKSYLAEKAKSKKNAPSALIRISKQSIVLRNQCVAKLGCSAALVFSASGVRRREKRNTGLSSVVSHPCGTWWKIIGTITWLKKGNATWGSQVLRNIWGCNKLCQSICSSGVFNKAQSSVPAGEKYYL